MRDVKDTYAVAQEETESNRDGGNDCLMILIIVCNITLTDVRAVTARTCVVKIPLPFVLHAHAAEPETPRTEYQTHSNPQP